MAKTRTFRLERGKIHFKCSICQAKRMVSVPMTVRRRSILCHKCKEITNCNLNRRLMPREQQLGKAELTTTNGRELDVNLCDKSRDGIGIQISVRDTTKISVGQQVQMRCSWNPRLFGLGRYIIQSIRTQRIGLKAVH